MRAEVGKAWHGLKEAGRLAHDDLHRLLRKHGYHKTHADGSHKHRTRNASFTLVVDDFGIKHTDKQGVEHLCAVLNSKCQTTIDWEGKRHNGITLDWNYLENTVKCSMPGVDCAW